MFRRARRQPSAAHAGPPAGTERNRRQQPGLEVLQVASAATNLSRVRSRPRALQPLDQDPCRRQGRTPASGDVGPECHKQPGGHRAAPGRRAIDRCRAVDRRRRHSLPAALSRAKDSSCHSPSRGQGSPAAIPTAPLPPQALPNQSGRRRRTLCSPLRDGAVRR